MSGGIFQSLEGLEELESRSRNPLVCYLCNELYEEPCLLHCFHTFCSRCLLGRAVDGKMACPLCGKSTNLNDGTSLPPTDHLLKFLVESSAKDSIPCSNCDRFVPVQDSDPMFFCNTCGQSLCGPCRDETHKAKMFAKHDIVHMSGRAKDIHKQCDIHQEPHIMFSTVMKKMLCINCFRDLSVESRAHCIDLDSAYAQGCKKLERAVLSIRELQSSVYDGVVLFRALLDELRRNMETERESIDLVCSSLQEIITNTKECLMKEVERQYGAKDHLFRSQLATLCTLLPTIQAHLIICTAFSSLANKFEFLDLAYILMERLASIAHMSYPLRPIQSSHIQTDFKAEFARNLEPFVCEKSVREMGVETDGSLTVGAISVDKSSDADSAASASYIVTTASTTVSLYSYSSGGSSQLISVHPLKLKIIESGGPFAEHCKDFDTKYREIVLKFSKTKEQVQELHRDITLRRCFTKKGKVADILNECSKLDGEIKVHKESIEELKSDFDKLWNEQLHRVHAEQEIYEAQINDLATLQSENQRLTTIIRQLEPFLKSINAVIDKISPRLQTDIQKEDRDDSIQAILEQISLMQPDSQQRLDNIQHEDEQPQNKSTELLTVEELSGVPASATTDENEKQETDKEREKEDSSSDSKGINDKKEGSASKDAAVYCTCQIGKDPEVSFSFLSAPSGSSEKKSSKYEAYHSSDDEILAEKGEKSRGILNFIRSVCVDDGKTKEGSGDGQDSQSGISSSSDEKLGRVPKKKNK